MKYQIVKTYDCVETTCGELVKKNFCVRQEEFVDEDDIDETYLICELWSWIYEQPPSKKLYLLTEIESKGGVI